MIKALVALLTAPIAAVAAAPIAAVAAAPVIAFHVADPRIGEASGIATGLRSSGVVYVQNDSGDRNRFFALDARTGATAATVTVPGATNVDWEDLAVAADAAGTPSVWLADTGDNGGARDEVRVYRVPEPRIAAGDRGRSVTSGRPEVFRLRYPGGAQDAESLAVAPGGAAYIVTKSVTGNSVVYRLPARPDRRTVQQLRPVGTVHLGLGGLATGAAFSRDGGRLVVRTYGEAYLWTVAGGDVAAAVTRAPTRVALPRQQQGEGVAFAGDRLLVDSEGVDQPVYSVPLPPSTASTAGTAPAAAATSPAPTTSGSTTPDGGSDNSGARSGVGVLILAVLVGGIVFLTRRNRRG